MMMASTDRRDAHLKKTPLGSLPHSRICHRDSLAMASRPLRALCLHGYRTNSAVMKDQTRALRAALGPNAEFVFLDGPFEARGRGEEIVEERYAAHRPFYEWGDIERLERSPEQPDNGFYHRYVGFDSTLELVDEQLRELGEVDIAVGFSQGAQMITALSMYYLAHRKETYWKCSLLCCGTRVRDAGLRPLFELPDGSPRKVPIPSIHILGKRDRFYETCREHSELYDDWPEGARYPKAVFEHDGGHRFPSADRYGDMYAQIAAMVRDHCDS